MQTLAPTILRKLGKGGDYKKLNTERARVERMNPAQAQVVFEEMYVDIEKMARKIAKDCGLKVTSDYLQECYTNAWRAILDYDPAHKTKVSTFVCTYMAQGRFKYLANTYGRTNRGEYQIVSLQHKSGCSCVVSDKIPMTDENLVSVNTELSYEQAINGLSETEMECVKLRLKNKTQAEIATCLGISQPHVGRIIGKIKVKFREYGVVV